MSSSECNVLLDRKNGFPGPCLFQTPAPLLALFWQHSLPAPPCRFRKRQCRRRPRAPDRCHNHARAASLRARPPQHESPLPPSLRAHPPHCAAACGLLATCGSQCALPACCVDALSARTASSRQRRRFWPQLLKSHRHRGARQ